MNNFLAIHTSSIENPGIVWPTWCLANDASYNSLDKESNVPKQQIRFLSNSNLV